MEKYKVKINTIDIDNNYFIINKLYYGEIIKGSVMIKIYDDDMNQQSLQMLEENDIVTIYGIMDKTKNNIVINKILIKNKYIFHSDSSEDVIDF